jgi:putative DNA-binding protein
MPDLAHVQSAFAEALLDRASGAPAPLCGAARRRAERRFAVYRNNVLTGLVSALAARFPVVQRLVGDEFFREMARIYVTLEPPRSPILLQYGETFAAFIDAFAPAAPIPYLGDIARLEMARGHAYHAPDIVPLAAQRFASLPAEGLARMRVKLHPSVSIISSGHPVYSIWYANQDMDRYVPIAPWAPEAALVARPDLDVEVHKLPSGGAAFLTALSEGGTFADAFVMATSADMKFDPVASLSLLIRANIVISFGRSARISR